MAGHCDVSDLPDISCACKVLPKVSATRTRCSVCANSLACAIPAQLVALSCMHSTGQAFVFACCSWVWWAIAEHCHKARRCWSKPHIIRLVQGVVIDTPSCSPAKACASSFEWHVYCCSGVGQSV